MASRAHPTDPSMSASQAAGGRWWGPSLLWSTGTKGHLSRGAHCRSLPASPDQAVGGQGPPCLGVSSWRQSRPGGLGLRFRGQGSRHTQALSTFTSPWGHRPPGVSGGDAVRPPSFTPLPQGPGNPCSCSRLRAEGRGPTTEPAPHQANTTAWRTPNPGWVGVGVGWQGLQLFPEAG